MLITPWSYEEYIKFYNIDSETDSRPIINDIKCEFKSDIELLCVSDEMHNVGGPDLICKLNTNIGEPKLLFREDLQKLVKFVIHDKYDVYHAICFGNTCHTYAINGNDVTIEVWDFIQENEIDYSKMTVDNFNLIKLLLLM